MTQLQKSELRYRFDHINWEALCYCSIWLWNPLPSLQLHLVWYSCGWLLRWWWLQWSSQYQKPLPLGWGLISEMLAACVLAVSHLSISSRRSLQLIHWRKRFEIFHHWNNAMLLLLLDLLIKIIFLVHHSSAYYCVFTGIVGILLCNCKYRRTWIFNHISIKREFQAHL